MIKIELNRRILCVLYIFGARIVRVINLKRKCVQQDGFFNVLFFLLCVKHKETARDLHFFFSHSAFLIYNNEYQYHKVDLRR